MESLKNILGKILTGFLFGVGFIFSAALLSSYAISYVTESTNENLDKTAPEKEHDDLYKRYDETAKLSAKVNTENIGDGLFTLLGEVSNNGDYSWESIRLKADLYDGKKRFIEQCETFVSEIIRPGKKINFKLSCRSNKCTTTNTNDFDSYKLIISNARYIPKS